MSDETTELQSLSKLKIAGRLRYWRGTIEIPETELHAICDEIQAEHEQAVAATLGSERHPYEQRITGDGSDWGEIMRDAYDDLMASACESCTPEQMEQLADYIRAELGSGTCEVEKGEGQQAHIDKLLALNGELCAEVNAKDVRIRALESLVRDWAMAPCAVCDPWVDDFACAWFDGSECSIRRRMAELGLEADA